MSTARDPALYDAAASAWWDGSRRWVRTLQAMVPARLRAFAKDGAEWRGRRVLDLGCAGGFMAEALAREGAEVHGLDPAAEAVAAARDHAAAEGLEIAYAVGVGEALPYPDASFDEVVCVDVLEHVGDLDRVLDEVARVLKPGGAFRFDTIAKNPLATLAVIWAAERILGLLPRGTHDPALFIRPSDLRARLAARGFAVGRFRGLGPTGVGRRFDLRFGLLPVTWVIYIGSAWKPG